MSFILDALKKSETERQQQSPAEFSSIPTSSDEPRPTRWLWLLGLLLFVNFGALIILLLKTSADDVPASAAGEAVTGQTDPRNFEEQVAVARDTRAAEQPLVSEPSPAEPVAEAPKTGAPAATRPAAGRIVGNASPSSPATIPTIDELILEGSLQLAPLHLDIHVFSEKPDERFVFINMNKHREGSRIDEGPLVREIRPDGVVLEHQGRSFLLPRQ